MSTFWVFLATFLASVTALPTDVPSNSNRLFARDDLYEWTALGDSYASGVGAGVMDPNSQRCMRFGDAYPRLMNVDSRMYGSPDRVFNNVVCSGAQTKDVNAQQFYDQPHNPGFFEFEQRQFGARPAFGKPQIATLSVGGNDIDLKGLIMNCVYQYLPTKSCTAQRAHSWELIRSDNLVNNIKETIKKIADKGKGGPAGDKFRLYVTGYGKLFNSETTQCNDVTFAWTGDKSPGLGYVTYKMTHELRRDFNDMADELNKAVKSAVDGSGPEVVFVPWDDVLDADKGHRYCEDFVTEPDANNPNVWFWQNADKSDSGFVGIEAPFFDALAKKVDSSVGSWGELEQKYGPKNGASFTEDEYRSPNNVTTDQVYDYIYAITAEKNDFIDTGFWKMAANVFRVFHPKTPLHHKISALILDQVVATAPAPSAPATPPPRLPMDERAAVCDQSKFLLPNEWTISNGKSSKTNLLFLMRDQACQGLCQNLKDIDGKYVAAVKRGEACEYTIKVHPNREMYMYITNPGQNCYDATARIESQCQGNSQGGAINGPNDGENYQFGVRDLNSEISWHPRFTDSSHLPFNQVHCHVYAAGLTDQYRFETSNFDDGDWGKSIQRNVHSNCGGAGAGIHWKYEPDEADSHHAFDGGQQSDHYGAFQSPWYQRGCTADTISNAMGLEKGMVSCD